MNHSKSGALKERGQTLLVAVLAMSVLLGFAAMAIDVGLFYEDRRHFQNSADAMALAGVAELPLNPAAAQTKAREWAALNDVADSEIKTLEVRTTGFPNDTLYVELEGEFDWIFARVLGQTTDNVGAEAAARTGTYAGGHNMMPWALLEGDTNCLDANGKAIFNASCVVKVGASDGVTGWRGALDFDGNGGGSNEYHDNIVDGDTDWEYCISGQDPPPCHGTVDALTGNKVGPTGQGIDERLAQGAKCDGNGNGVDDFDEVFEPTGLATPEYTVACPDSPWLIIIPIVSYESVPIQEVTIRGWTLGYLHGYSCYSNSSSANLTENAVVFGGRSMGADIATVDASASGDSDVIKTCHRDTSERQAQQTADDSFVMAIEPGGPLPGALFGPNAPPACHQGTPHGQNLCTPSPTPTPDPTPAPTAAPTPTPEPTAGPTPTPEPSSGATPTPGPVPSAQCSSGKGHWEVQIEIADAAYSQSAGFLGAYDPTSGIIIRRLIK
ncbi:MAG TPA: Tad domain-containing protein [Dehalococcoidia bacterium]|jgi:hypothetical protein|nr:Tad domain-containing protein [Dehalococcoidia bacterium]